MEKHKKHLTTIKKLELFPPILSVNNHTLVVVGWFPLIEVFYDKWSLLLKKWPAQQKKRAGALPVCCIWNGSLQQHCCSKEPQLFEPGMPWRQLVARQPSTTGVLHFPLLVALRSSSVSCYSTCMLTVGAIESTSHKNCLCWVGSHAAAGV